MADKIKKQLDGKPWTAHFDREKDTLRVEDEVSKKGVTISLPGIIAKWENQKEQAVSEVVYYIEEALTAMTEAQDLGGKEKKLFPVIRSTSFPTENSEGTALLFDDHTAETRIFYALDLGNSYRLIDRKMMERENWGHERIRETALFNLRSLKTVTKKDTVAGNTFYFLRANDGYDASRILDESVVQSFHERISGTMAVALPHQDVVIFADIQNDTGYDVLAQMAMSFFASGRVPITALSFLYEENKWEPIFILGKNRPKDSGKDEK
ncbi:DUF1444 domain-containing protein [Metabacillus sp. GX 13764]|uniref:DUF1444 domain-containing protein n=1 Tax=Metabacillus kandeliae TaxID=2900151 RepID=UPI001E2C8EA1|nr:DUF1444 domain-containing protein [Metabacillus kandeliae]MCD7032720.1 DUF1444 domain-containing protein [Metabacillus kandeliae]